MLTLSNADLSITCLPLGAELAALSFRGKPLADMGAIKGRVGNRIAGGRFVLNGTEYRIPQNDGKNTLHGGPEGFGKRIWDECEEQDEQGRPVAVYRLHSADGDQGFPGAMDATVRYTLLENSVQIVMEATCDQDTIVNLVNHAYFNLNGLDNDPVALGSHRLRIDADRFTAVRPDKIPTGDLPEVSGTAFDFRSPKVLSRNFDHNFVLTTPSLARPCAELTGLTSGIRMEVLTDQPGLQLYNTDSRICLEAQNFPDAIHYAHFPSSVLKAGERYCRTVIYRFF